VPLVTRQAHELEVARLAVERPHNASRGAQDSREAREGKPQRRVNDRSDRDVGATLGQAKPTPAQVVCPALAPVEHNS
jgi:hypothetical protein